MVLRSRGISAMAVAASVAALAGCASSSAHSVTARTKTRATVASGGSVYKVGVPMPETGPNAQAGTEIFDAEQLAADQINAHGGVLGHKIKLYEQDDACEAQTGASAAAKLVSLGVQAFVGNYCSGAALPGEPIVARAGLPNIQPSANDPSLTSGGFKNVFLMDPNATGDATEATAFFKRVVHAKKVLVADDQSAFGVSVADAAAADMRKAGISVPPIQAVPATTTDFSAVIAVIKRAGVQGVYWSGYYAQSALFVKQLRAAGLKNVVYVGADGTVDPAFIQEGGAAANGTYATIVRTTQFLRGKQANAFVKEYRARFHSAPGPYSAFGYDAMNTLAAAIKKAHSIAPAKVIAALHSIHLTGLTGPISFARNGSRQGAKFVVLEVRHGQYTIAPKQP
jgi:branched-chain amino acid transport system substrate-binding protein